MIELLKTISAGQWSFIGFLSLMFTGIVVMLVRDYVKEKEFRREYDDQEDKFI